MIRKTFLAAALMASVLLAAPAFAAPATTSPATSVGSNALYLADPSFQLTFGPNAASVVTAPIDALTKTPATKVGMLTAPKCFGGQKEMPPGYTDGAGVPWDSMFNTIVDPSVKHHLLKVVLVPSAAQPTCAVAWFMYSSDDPVAIAPPTPADKPLTLAPAVKK